MIANDFLNLKGCSEVFEWKNNLPTGRKTSGVIGVKLNIGHWMAIRNDPLK